MARLSGFHKTEVWNSEMCLNTLCVPPPPTEILEIKNVYVKNVLKVTFNSGK